MSTWFRRLTEAVVIGCLMVAAAVTPLSAQTTGRSGIEGKVTDDSGGTLPGVTVTISSAALQIAQMTTTSDQDGRYRFAALPVGVYDVVFELQGFKTNARRQLQVAFGTVATIDVVMAVGQLEETVTVTGSSPVVDVRTTMATTNLSKDLIHTLPTNRTVAELVKLAPGMRGGTNYGASGTISHTYDGVQARDTFRYPDLASLEEVQVRAVGNDAEVATAGVNFIGVIKSGGNDFHGYYLGQWEGKNFQSNNIDDALRAQGISEGNRRQRYYDTNADLGGRIVRDRLWFYTGTRHLADKFSVLGFSGAPGPDGVYYTADDVQGYNENRDRNYTTKVTGQLTPLQKINGVYSWEQGRTLHRGAGAFRPAETTGNYKLPNHLVKVEYTYNPTSRSIVNAFVANTQWQSSSYPYVDGQSAFDNVTRRWYGPQVNSSGLDSAPVGSNSERWIYNGTYTYYRPDLIGGDHEFKVGVELTREWYDKWQLPRDTGTGGKGNDYLAYFENGVPFEVLLYNSPITSDNNLNTQTLFARDNWLINDRLTLSLGIRAERYDSFLPAQSKEAGPFSPAQSFEALDVYDWRSFAPRAAVSYALTADKRTVVKATFGRFNEVNAAIETRPFNQNDYVAWRYRWLDVNGNKIYDHPHEQGELIAVESAISDNTSVPGLGAGVKVLNRDLRQPKTNELSVHLERELVDSLSLRLGYVYKKQFDRYQEMNPLRPASVYNIAIPSADPGPDGVRGTADDGGAITYYDYDASVRGPLFDQNMQVNTPGFTNRYHNLEVTATKRLSSRWQLLSSYLATRVDAWRAGTPRTPNDVFPKAEYWEKSFKLSGSYLMPLDVQVSSYYEFLSGAQLARDVRFTAGLRQQSQVVMLMEPIGAQRLPGQKRLNIRFEKTQRLTRGQMSFGVELYNALNANFETAKSVRSGPTYGRITAIAAPRNARLMASYRF